jgi:alpha-L-fucosidase
MGEDAGSTPRPSGGKIMHNAIVAIIRFRWIGILTVVLLLASPLNSAAQSRFDEYLKKIDDVANRGPFKPNWQSLEAFQVPAWYIDGKFGIFIHWGAYSVPGFGNEWYPRNMYQEGSKEFKHHLEAFGPQLKFGYKDFLPMFKAEQFNADQWAALFKESGARFVVPVAEHHDGFPMYDYSFTDWSAAKMGPHRDVVGQLAAALRKQGLVLGASSHRAEHWWFFDQGMKFDSDVRDPKYAGLYGPARDQKAAENQSAPPDQAYLNDWLVRTCELVDKYQPQLIWFDWWIAQPAFHPYLQKFSSYYYNRGKEWNKEVAINYKKHGGESFPDKAGVLDIERGQLAEIRPFFWQTDTSVSKNSWGYVQNQDYKTVDSIVDDLVDIVSKNGALLLNIGPKPDGTIPEPERKMLQEIGAWLKVNGEAIYGTRPWRVFGEGPTQVVSGPFADTKRKPFTSEDFRFTTKGPTLYAIALAWPDNGKLLVKGLAKGGAAAVKQVTLLGHGGSLDWKQTDQGLEASLPPAKPCDYAFALKIVLIRQ